MPAEKWTVVVVLYKQNYKQSSHRVGHEVVVQHWTWHARCVINDEAGQISLVNIKHLVRHQIQNDLEYGSSDHRRMSAISFRNLIAWVVFPVPDP